MLSILLFITFSKGLHSKSSLDLENHIPMLKRDMNIAFSFYNQLNPKTNLVKIEDKNIYYLFRPNLKEIYFFTNERSYKFDLKDVDFSTKPKTLTAIHFKNAYKKDLMLACFRGIRPEKRDQLQIEMVKINKNCSDIKSYQVINKVAQSQKVYNSVRPFLFFLHQEMKNFVMKNKKIKFWSNEDDCRKTHELYKQAQSVRNNLMALNHINRDPRMFQYFLRSCEDRLLYHCEYRLKTFSKTFELSSATSKSSRHVYREIK